ncbi:MAG: hypothetical protein CMF25_00060 [Kangiellaceae bacterium]|nr:hypothetical protein [Kangiellaceae bacterium]|tara:strand:+ start:3384 stop:7241 length:3858 start_codon:yes stop_codon:yes gene_type:complete
MATDKRRYQRHAIDIAARITMPDQPDIPCRVLDCCKGGMLLSKDESSLQSVMRWQESFQRGQSISLEYIIPQQGRERHFRVAAIVARSSEESMGIAFHEPPQYVIRALEEFVSHQAPKAEKPAETKTVANADGIREKCLHQLESLLPDFSHKLVVVLEQALEDKRQHAYSNKEFNECEAAIKSLNRMNQRIQVKYRSEVTNAFRELGKVKPKANNGLLDFAADELSIVEDNEFEEWLSSAQLSTRAETRYKGLLYELESRLSVLVKQNIDKSNNPLAPAEFANAFSVAIRPVRMESTARKVVHSRFEQFLVEYLESIYQSVNQLLIDNHVLPDLKPEIRPVGQRQAVSLGGQSSPATEKAYMDAEEKASPLKTEHLSNAATGMLHSLRQPVSLGANQAVTDAPNAAPAENGDLGELAIPHPQPSAEQRAAAVSNEQLWHTLNEMQKQIESLSPEEVKQGNLQYRIEEQLSGDNEASKAAKAISDDIGLLEGLIEAILIDELLPEAIKPWVKKLEVPLLKVATIDPSFFSNKEHVARVVLNRLARLGVLMEEQGKVVNKSLEQKIAESITRILNEFDKDLTVFEEIAEVFDEWVKRLTEGYNARISRIIKASENQQHARKNRTFMNEQLGRRMAGRQLPSALVDLLAIGWFEVLWLTSVREGEHSDSAKRHLNQAEDLINLLDKEQHQEYQHRDLVELLDIVTKTLRATSSDTIQQKNNIKVLLDLGQNIAQGEDVSEHYQQLTIDYKPQEDHAKIKVPPPKELSGQEWNTWLQQASRLEVGDWVQVRGQNNDVQKSKLIWFSETRDQYIFVNGRGIKVADISLEELALQLFQSSTSVMDMPDMPLVDRASYPMLQKMYKQLEYKATHDELTKLSNRKEFDRKINDYLKSAKTESHIHCLLYIDLDQFKIVNNNCGHNAGDELLRQVAVVLRKIVKNHGLVCRLGGDEFGILLQRCSLENGIKCAESCLQNIPKHAFSWEDKQFRITASIGVTPITKASADSVTLLKQADSACFAAKDAGRNRYQLYHADDKEIKVRNRIMSWVVQLDSLLDKGRFELRSQKIAAAIGNTAPHYEILLGIRDEDNQIILPSEFIASAELYNRMPAIDRWVVHNVFEWLDNNRDRFGEFGHLAINLSGQTLNDVHSTEYIIDEIRQRNIPTNKLCFEVTETAAISKLSNAAVVIQKLKQTGVTFSLDDFGSGFSSYAYLAQLPVDYIKIDGAFVADMMTNPNDSAVVKSINEIGHFMGKKTIAERVENKHLKQLLTAMGVDYLQGFGIHKPCLLNEM